MLEVTKRITSYWIGREVIVLIGIHQIEIPIIELFTMSSFLFITSINREQLLML